MNTFILRQQEDQSNKYLYVFNELDQDISFPHTTFKK
jgi:hypothetical protein